MKSGILFTSVFVCALLLTVSCSDESEQKAEVDVAEREIAVDTSKFPKHVEVFGLDVYGTASAPDDKVLHAASVLAEYLDSDEDGIPDNQKIVDAMVSKNATLIAAKNMEELRELGGVPFPNWQNVWVDNIGPQRKEEDLYDQALEEILHLITDHGWEGAYPSAFGRWRGTEIAKASEAARGGYFEEVPEKYPEGAWHTYYAESCDYGCHIAEYIHWGMTSILGGHERYWKRLGGKDQWDLRNREKVKSGDPTLYALLTDPQYKLPTVLPDGKYRGKELQIQHADDDASAAKNAALETNPFTKQVEVFGIYIYATDKVADEKMLHTADVLAQYLDNDEDGTPDNQKVVDEIVKHGGGIFMTEYEGKYEGSELERIFDKYLPPGPKQSVYDSQTYPNALVDGVFNIPREEVLKGAQDAPWEEVLHLVTGQGYAHAYPSVFGYTAGSELADAMDLARGGHFPDRRPEKYPDGAWFTYYDDYSCTYDCMMTEYIYWALTSILGAQEVPGRLEAIQEEWRLNTKEEVQAGDPAVYALLTDPQYKFPTVLPDAEYRAKKFEIQKYP